MNLMNVERMILQRAILHNPIFHRALFGHNRWRIVRVKEFRRLTIHCYIKVGWTVWVGRIG